jgi:phosphohistidine phosphatase
MKSLLLMRHAKTVRDNPMLRDYDRPLDERGRADAPRMGARVKAAGILPNLIVSSPARRARETVEAFITATHIDLKPQFDDTIYGATCAELMQLVRSLPDISNCTLLVGHNPGMEELLGRLTSSYLQMPPAACACLEIQAEHWQDVVENSARLVWLHSPDE